MQCHCKVKHYIMWLLTSTACCWVFFLLEDQVAPKGAMVVCVIKHPVVLGHVHIHHVAYLQEQNHTVRGVVVVMVSLVGEHRDH